MKHIALEPYPMTYVALWDQGGALVNHAAPSNKAVIAHVLVWAK